MVERARIIRSDELDEIRACEKTLEDARVEAAALVEQAREEAENLRADILNLAQKEAIEKAREILSHADEVAQNQLGALEQEVSLLVAETVAKVIGDIDRNDAVKAATKTALAALAETTSAKIRSAPDVFRAVSDAVSEAAQDGRSPVSHVRQDESLTGDRVILSSDRGHSEIGLADQIEAATEPWRSGA